jgi:peptidoglycan hydrolase-like protein with peptidoglycan-binding domain
VSVSLCLCLLAFAPKAATSGDAVVFSAARRPPGQPNRAPSSEFIKGGQRELKRAGYDPGAIDGKIGPSTRSALLRFQKAHGLPTTGEFDIPTLTKLIDHSLQR